MKKQITEGKTQAIAMNAVAWRRIYLYIYT